jgi:hypothetical protein
MTPAELLRHWLHRQLSAPTWQWVDSQCSLLAGNPRDRELYLAISLVSRKLGKEDLRLDTVDLDDAREARTDWDPRGWSVDQAGRILFLLSTKAASAKFSAWLDQLCQTADVGELVAFYRGLPLYPDPPLHRLRAAEGVRSNMKAVFESVAHRNPYPREELPEGAWNQMVLKALFVGSALHPIQGLDERGNPTLMRMLCDYAHERWAATRPVSPELWRCVGRHADPAAIADLQRVLDTGTIPERQAAALALADCRDPAARKILGGIPDLERAVASGSLTWESIAQPS